MRRVVRRVLFCTAIPLIAQRDRGTITGAISDPAAAIIAGAKVVAQHTETGTTSETQTTSTGNYTLPAITAGVYDVSVTATGFSRLLQRAVRVQVAQTVRTDMTLCKSDRQRTPSPSPEPPRFFARRTPNRA